MGVNAVTKGLLVHVGVRDSILGVIILLSVQTLNRMQGGMSGSASPSFEDGNYRVGKYSLEERKLRIHRYQQKRSQRNFNKKIKVHLLLHFLHISCCIFLLYDLR